MLSRHVLSLLIYLTVLTNRRSLFLCIVRNVASGASVTMGFPNTVRIDDGKALLEDKENTPHEAKEASSPSLRKAISVTSPTEAIGSRRVRRRSSSDTLGSLAFRRRISEDARAKSRLREIGRTDKRWDIWMEKDVVPDGASRPNGIESLRGHLPTHHAATFPLVNGHQPRDEVAHSEAGPDVRGARRELLNRLPEDSIHSDSQIPDEPRWKLPDDAAETKLSSMSFRKLLDLELSTPDASRLNSSSLNPLYEPAEVKLERLLNFVLLPPHLEWVLWFGTLACLDAWLYIFTILPLRFFRVMQRFGQHWAINLYYEAQFLTAFIRSGSGRLWTRYVINSWRSTPRTKAALRRSRSDSDTKQGSASRRRRKTAAPAPNLPPKNIEQCKAQLRHRSRVDFYLELSRVDKADLLRGLVILISSFVLMKFDASKVYHSIRGQATIKLYVIYNVLEVSLVFHFSFMTLI